ncbi:DUF3742 family protein [Pseudomonas silesiensis]|uniref:DUF3742 family protein n=1 Tax=Pseudomonas silesiensis TaxID=1853130 RepID=UPI0034D79D66
MSPNKHINNAERLGRWLGGLWRGYVRRERQAVVWMVAGGVPAGVAAAVLWVAKIAVLGALLYVAFWIALLIVFATLVAWTARNTEVSDNDDKSEWRYGDSGYGLYTSEGYRIDPHDPENEQR